MSARRICRSSELISNVISRLQCWQFVWNPLRIFCARSRNTCEHFVHLIFTFSSIMKCPPAVSLVLPALVVLWLGVGGSPPQSAGDFEQCVEQVEAKGPSKWGARCLMTTCNARAGRRKAS